MESWRRSDASLLNVLKATWLFLGNLHTQLFRWERMLDLHCGGKVVIMLLHVTAARQDP
jgi:hypothetical protein